MKFSKFFGFEMLSLNLKYYIDIFYFLLDLFTFHGVNENDIKIM